MKNTDTSELLPNTDDAPVVDVLTAVAQCAAAWEPGARLLGNVRACDILRAVTHAKSRLQAEAPEDAEVLREVMLALEDLSFECFSPIAPCNPPSVATYSRTFDVLDRHRKARGWATVPKTAISKPRTSQAEAQAPAVTQKREREGHKYADHDGTSDCAHGCGAWMGPFRSGAPNGINPFGECPKAPLLPTPAQAEAQAPTTAALTKIAVHREVVAAIQSFTAGVNMFEAANEAASCIIALQTTTAASVLTEDDRRIYNQSMTRYWEKASDELMAARLRAIIDRLTSTVGAPAPAPTMPTREQIAAAAYRAFRTPHPLQNPPYTSDGLKIADAILALIAKGDTP